MKKIFALLLVLVMCTALALPALATEDKAEPVGSGSLSDTAPVLYDEENQLGETAPVLYDENQIEETAPALYEEENQIHDTAPQLRAGGVIGIVAAVVVVVAAVVFFLLRKKK